MIWFKRNGEWSDSSPIWNQIDAGTKERLEIKIENDGEFWMSYDDWIRNFDNCQICNLTPDTIGDSVSNVLNKDSQASSHLISVSSNQTK